MPRLPVLHGQFAGEVPDANLFATIAVRPEIAGAAGEHLRAVMQCGTVPAATKALCAAMVSAINFCEPALVAYRREARAAGVSIDALNALWDFARSDHFTNAQKAALSAAVSLTREARALPDTVWNQLRAEYGDGEIVEILCVIGIVNALNRVSNALQTPVTR
ncbi:MAG TPA: carboxymuconolactone decarboxylase family protein [Candidatus Baltobacteraceae bacterium]|nr:carboxymuconolactone decarboxylase family protein [Candidatus Baltobacteraceae bacterium]